MDAEKKYADTVKDFLIGLGDGDPEDQSRFEQAEELCNNLPPMLRDAVEKSFGGEGEIDAAIQKAKIKRAEKLIDLLSYKKTGETVLELDEVTRVQLENYNDYLKALKNFQKYCADRGKTDKLYARTIYLGECSSIAYEELLKYPKSYKNSKISMDVEIAEIEKGTFSTTIHALERETGQPVELKDNRKIKEPILKEGDTLIVYGTFEGTKTLRIKDDGSGWFGTNLFGKTKESIDIPTVDFVFSSIDNLGVITSGDPGAENIIFDEKREEMLEKLLWLAEQLT